MALLIWALCWTWAVVFGYFAQDYALPLIGLDALSFWSYAWVSLILLIASLPISLIKALVD